MKRVHGVFLTCIGILFISATMAGAVSLKAGPFYGQFTNFETLNLPDANTPANDPDSYFANNGDGIQDNVGVFRMNTIMSAEISGSDGAGNPILSPTDIWFATSSTEELTGYFYGIDVQSWTYNADADQTNVQSVGGHMEVWLGTGADKDWNASDPTLAQATNGVLVLTLDFVPGAVPGNDATVDGNFNGDTLPASGNALAYLSVTGGLWAQYFDSDFWSTTWTDDGGTIHHDKADIRITNDFFVNLPPTATEGFNLRSSDPIEGNVVPEPTTIGLLGIGLIGLAGISYRKKLARRS